MTSARFQAVEIDPWTHGYAIYDERDEDRYLVQAATKEQAEYGVMILRAGGIGDWDDLDFNERRDTIEEMILYTNCTSCEQTFMQGQLDASKRCDECAS